MILDILDIVLIVVIVGGFLFEHYYMKKARAKTKKYLYESRQEMERHIALLEKINNGEVAIIVNAYENQIIDPRNIVGDMSFDEFMDWLEIGTIDDVKAARKVFVEHKMNEHVKIIDAYIKKNS